MRSKDELLIEHLRSLRGGASIQVPVYDFETYCHSPQDYGGTAVDCDCGGFWSWSIRSCGEMFDLKVFVDTDSDVRVLRA